VRTGIIGGSGLYAIDGVEVIDRLRFDTPYGSPSDELILTQIDGHEVVFLPRHGRGHTIQPHRINYRANIYAMKMANVERVISISAVGSLREHIEPGHFVIIDQFMDRTSGRDSTFFDQSIVAHVSMADPVCSSLRQHLLQACRDEGITTHDGGTYLSMQGPQFSTRAESEMYRMLGMDVIGMTNMPEAKLAREAEMCYATVAMSTDYDCWHEDEADVNVADIVEIMRDNVEKAQRMVLSMFARKKSESTSCTCRSALEHAILTDLASQEDDSIRPVHAIVERFL